jgi:NAD(P)-dependent dehydrogenase (short-subunit alcohol dehydrogenase family)
LSLEKWRNDAGLAGNSVVVTGAAGGIGREVARAFSEAGALVLLVDMPGSKLDETLAQLSGTGHAIMEADLTDLSTHPLIFFKAETLAPFVALAHCAAVLRRRKSVEDVTEEDWDIQIDVNLKSTFFLNRAAYLAMKDGKRGGAIVNFASQGWWTGGFGGSVVYAASKGAIVSLTRGLARSFAPAGIRVNVVSPGGVDTSMLREGQTDEAMKDFIGMIPMGRLAEPAEMTGAVLFLASNASSYMTGALLNVSGGQLMY